MPWEPGKSGNPNGYKGPRDRARRQVFDTIKNLGHKDALETLSYLQHNEQIEPGLRIAAASALAPYCHPKMQATPTPRFVECQIEVPEFTHLSHAEQFLAKIAALVARGELDIQTGLELSTLAKNWIDAQYAREELAIKQYNAGSTEHEQTIRIEGGLPALPGTNITMPLLDGHATNGNGHALAAPTAAVSAIEAAPKAQDPEPPPQDPEL